MILSKIVQNCTNLYFFFSVCGTRSYHVTSQSSHRVKRIVQGNKADYAEWPWQISLRERDESTYNEFFLCLFFSLFLTYENFLKKSTVIAILTFPNIFVLLTLCWFASLIEMEFKLCRVFQKMYVFKKKLDISVHECNM